ncbi:MAG TPA: hybrid sensor histidine kinase/response regulator [Chitinophagaceae bacterium]|nr:hybrid sensor histidine kinase/response regulator [Chitinophagaceae bacterium]
MQNFTILIVDDKEENIIALQDILEAEDRKFISATSGNEALKLVLKNEDIGLILLDVQMPGMDGFEVAKLLKSNPKTKDISIIFVTAINKDEHYVLKGFSEGAVDYLQKPLDINVTKAKVRVFEQLYFYQQKLKQSISDITYINKQLEQFVYIVSHDLKSPLATIITILSLLEKDERLVSQNDLYNNIEMLNQSAIHLSDMITAILDYSKKSVKEQQVEEVDVYELVLQITYLLFPPNNIHIDIVTPMPVIRTRRLKLMQVFQNLISNAIKYNDKEVGRIEIGCKEKEEFYEFFVKDNGPGISQKDQERIFYLFEVTKNKARNESSTGVGLNIMKMMVEEQGGKLWVETKENDGSCFYFQWRR